MIKKFSPRDMFFGWWTVIASGVISGLGHGFVSYGFSALFKPLSAELNFNRTVTSVAAGIGRLEGGIEAPLTGWLSDRFGPRWVIVAGICIAGVGLILMNYINSVWTYYVVWGLLIGTGINLSMTLAMDKTITNWFIKKRGLAHGIKFALIGVFAMIALPVITWQVESTDWRLTCLVWGVVMFVCAPFAAAAFKQQRPEYYGMLPDGAKAEEETESGSLIERGIEYASGFQEEEFTLRQAMKTPAYWLLVIAVAGYTIVYGGLTVHCIPFLTDRGIDATTAGALMGMMIFFTVPARFLGGVIADKVSKGKMPLLLGGSFLFQAIGIGVFCLFPSMATIYVMLIFYGFGSGATTPLYLLILGRYFGRKAYGSIHGSTNLLRAPVQFISPIYAGWVYDSTGSYQTALIVFAITALISTVLMLFARPPKAPEQRGDISKFI